MRRSSTYGLSRLEHVLTIHMRQWLQRVLSKDQISMLCFCLALSTCLLDAAVMLFPLFTGGFADKLGFGRWENNVVAASMLMGLYLTLPALGYMSDIHGPVLLATVGVCVGPGFWTAAWVVAGGGGGSGGGLQVWILAVAFFLVGMGTSSAYFCSLVTCARVFPQRKGLGIVLPGTLYGLSGFVMAWVVSWVMQGERGPRVDLEGVFIGLGWMYIGVGAVNWVSSLVVSIEKSVVWEQQDYDYGAVDETETDEEEQVRRDEIQEETKFRAFIRDPRMSVVVGSMFCLAGPLEVFVANMGDIGAAMGRSGGEGQEANIVLGVGVFSVMSTVLRVIVGVVVECQVMGADDVANGLKLAMGAGLLAWGGMLTVPVWFVGGCGMCGAAYGTVFTALPMVVAGVWGVEVFGAAWGLCLAAPAVGSGVLGMAYSAGVPVSVLGALCAAGGAMLGVVRGR